MRKKLFFGLLRRLITDMQHLKKFLTIFSNSFRRKLKNKKRVKQKKDQSYFVFNNKIDPSL